MGTPMYVQRDAVREVKRACLLWPCLPHCAGRTLGADPGAENQLYPACACRLYTDGFSTGLSLLLIMSILVPSASALHPAQNYWGHAGLQWVAISSLSPLALPSG